MIPTTNGPTQWERLSSRSGWLSRTSVGSSISRTSNASLARFANMSGRCECTVRVARTSLRGGSWCIDQFRHWEGQYCKIVHYIRGHPVAGASQYKPHLLLGGDNESTVVRGHTWARMLMISEMNSRTSDRDRSTHLPYHWMRTHMYMNAYGGHPCKTDSCTNLQSKHIVDHSIFRKLLFYLEYIFLGPPCCDQVLNLWKFEKKSKCQ